MKKDETQKRLPMVQRLSAILWPSFVLAGIATVIFFGAFDPEEILESERHLRMNRLGVYTVGFFLFWLLTALASLLGIYFHSPTSNSGRSE